MTSDDPHSVLARQAELIAKVWPGGIAARDSVVLEAVPLPARGQLLDRLEAVWRADRGEPLAPLAELAGLKRAGFFNLRRAWRENSLAGLVPHGLRSGRGVTLAVDDPLREVVAKQLRIDPWRRNVDVAKSVLDADPSLAHDASPHEAVAVLQKLTRLVAEQRRALSLDADFLRDAYGRGLILDLTAVSVVLTDGERGLAIVAMLMETASGLMLGSALGRADDGVGLQREAAAAGLQFLHAHHADLRCGEGPVPDFAVMLPAGVDAEVATGALAPYVDELTVGKAGGFSFGYQVVQVVGTRIGRMVLQPRKTLSFDVDAFLETRLAQHAPLDVARAIWAREVERHNAERIAALTQAGIINGGVPDGRLASALRAALMALQPA